MLIEKGIQLIREAPIQKLLDRNYLERELIINLGLNSEASNEQPIKLHPYLGKGCNFRIWQYPNQFSQYLLILARYASRIESYLEIGCRHGGTFILTTEYLKRFNPKFMLSVAVDLNDESEQLKQYRNYQSFDYLKINSRSKEFASYCKNHFDLCLIDGDHSFEGVLSDFSLIRDSTKINVFHDITSKACPGTTNFWQLLKVFYGPDKHSIYEFTDQYEDTIDRGPFLGIGVVVHNDRL